MKRILSLTLALLLVAIACLNPTPIHAAQTHGQLLPMARGGALSGRELVVQVPRALHQVVMEQKVGKGWKPVKVQHLTFAPGERSKVLAITLPQGVQLSQVRMKGYANAKFPARFTRGARQFSRPDPMSAGGGQMMPSGGVPDPRASSNTLDDGSTPATAPAAVESDIWKIVGNQLFFFNQYRGLQVLDLTAPTAPVRTGTLRLAASGEQMYVLNPAGSAVALVGQSNTMERAGHSSLYLLRVQEGVPTLMEEVPLQGSVLDSRLIGDRLYVLSSVWPAPDENGVSEGVNQLVLQTIDLTEAAEPVLLPQLVFPASHGSLQAAADHLLIGAGDYSWSGSSEVMHLIDIATADGAPALVKSFPVKGFLADKFKMSLVEGAAVAVSNRWQHGRLETWVETFPLAGPETLPLAALELQGARNETLHATRFDGDRLYVVTFRQIDPLFVVDLADPTQPRVSGTLEIPGWSTYLEPLGDRLLAVGVEGQRVAISLFDVADAMAPALLSRLYLGEAGGWSWSEASYDEKAVEYSAAEGLLFVPFQTWSEGGEQQAIQVIHVGRDLLTPEQTIQSSDQARRGTVLGNYFVTISGQELIVSDRTASETTPPVQFSLAWRVDRVVPLGAYLLQLDDGPQNLFAYYPMRPWSAPSDGQQAMIRVTRADDPDSLVAEIALGRGRIVATAQKDRQLFVAQWLPATGDKGATLLTRVWDLSDPPAVTEVATVEHGITVAEGSLRLDGVQGLWLGDERLLWYLPGRAEPWYWWGGPRFIDLPVVGMEPAPISGRLQPASMAIAEPSPLAPAPMQTAALLCPITLTDTPTASPLIAVSSAEELREASPAQVENGFVFFSYDTATELPPTPLPAQVARPFWLPPPMQLRSNLQVIDFRQSTVVVRDPVSIPGQLLSVSQADSQGAVLLTNIQAAADQANRRIQAAAYDGVTAWQLDERSLDVPFWAPSVSDGTRLFFARDGETPGVNSIGYDAASGRLQDAGTWTTTTTPATLSVLGHYLLASSYGTLEVAEITDSGIDDHDTVFATPSNLWLRVDRTARSSRGLWIPANDFGVEFLPWQEVRE